MSRSTLRQALLGAHRGLSPSTHALLDALVDPDPGRLIAAIRGRSLAVGRLEALLAGLHPRDLDHVADGALVAAAERGLYLAVPVSHERAERPEIPLALAYRDPAGFADFVAATDDLDDDELSMLASLALVALHDRRDGVSVCRLFARRHGAHDLRIRCRLMVAASRFMRAGELDLEDYRSSTVRHPDAGIAASLDFARSDYIRTAVASARRARRRGRVASPMYKRSA